MTRGPARGEGTLNGPVLIACGAFLSPREKTSRCQACYGRRKCLCAAGTWMPCVSGEHISPGSKRVSPGRAQSNYVDVNFGRRGLGK